MKMFNKHTLETIVSFSEFWGVLITLVGALLLFVTVIANRPLKKLLASEAEQERQEAEHKRLELQSEIARAQEAAAVANQRAEQERLARLRIEERLAARRISPEQLRDLVQALKPYANSTVVVDRLGDFEARQFADELIKAFSAARWSVKVQNFGIVSPPVYGLQCVVADSRAGRALSEAVKELPTAEVTVVIPANLPNADAHITVGLKPPP